MKTNFAGSGPKNFAEKKSKYSSNIKIKENKEDIP